MSSLFRHPAQTARKDREMSEDWAEPLRSVAEDLARIRAECRKECPDEAEIASCAETAAVTLAELGFFVSPAAV